MGLVSWLLGKNKGISISLDDLPLIENAKNNVYLKQQAVDVCTDLIANMACLAEFQTNDARLSHRLNVRANRNQNALAFRRQLIKKLLHEGEVLIVQNKQHYLFVADSFTKTSQGMNDYVFENVVVNGMTITERATSMEIYYIELSDKRIEAYMASLDNSYADLFKRIVEFQMTQQQIRMYGKFRMTTGKKEEDLNKFKSFLEKLRNGANTASVLAIPVQDDYDISEKQATHVGKSVDEVKKVSNQYLSEACRVFGIPPLLLTGDLADVSQHREILVQRVHGLLKLIATEINAKYFEDEKDKDLQHNKVKVGLFNVIFNSELSASKEIEKLIGSGVYTIDDVLEAVGRERLNTNETTKRLLTKNIGTLKGGEIDE